MSQTLQSVLCINTNKYLVHVLVVLLHARFSVVGPIPFLLAAIFFLGPSLYRKYYRTSRYGLETSYFTDKTSFTVAGPQMKTQQPYRTSPCCAFNSFPPKDVYTRPEL